MERKKGNKKTAFLAIFNASRSQKPSTCLLPSPNLKRTLKSWEYIAMLKEKLLEIKRFYGDLKLSPVY